MSKMQNNPKKIQQDTMMLRIDTDLKKDLQHIAQQKGISLSGLVRMWVIERLQDELARSDNSK